MSRSILHLVVCISLVAAVMAAAIVTSQAVQQPAAGRGAIRGSVTLRRAVAAGERRPNVSDLGAPTAHDLPDRLVSVVYLDSAPRGAFEQADGGHAVMIQRNETFVPHVLAVTVGTVVEFPNADRFYHNVFSLSKVARFDLGRYAMGKSKSVRFDRPGIVRVFCDIHSHMNAFILVFSHPFFGMTDAEGHYRIDNVPPGAYNIVAWNEGTSSDPSPVTVTGGSVSELDFVLRP